MFPGVYTYPIILFSTENRNCMFIYGVDFDVARFNGMGMRRPQIEKRATGRGSRFFFGTSPADLSHIITFRNRGFETAINNNGIIFVRHKEEVRDAIRVAMTYEAEGAHNNGYLLNFKTSNKKQPLSTF